VLTSIVLLTFNQLEFTKHCIDSIRTYTDKDAYELIIIDNASTDGTVDWLKRQTGIKVIYNTENLGFPKGCNQGIEVSKGDNILLLNNDTVVTFNWLDNLLKCLYSDENIGAVGPVTNSLAYYSTIPVDYNELGEMHSFAKKYNISDRQKWEERLKLVGYCLLLKREVVDKIGLLDENFSPGNYEDDDYSLRIRRSGYKLIFCRDTFIHHYGSVSWINQFEDYSSLLSINHKKFIDKWGIDPTSFVIHTDIIGLIDLPKEKELSILHIGCQSGGTLLHLKNKYVNAHLFGIEKNPILSREASAYANVTNIDIETEGFNYQEKSFDVIILSDFETVTNSDYVLNMIKRYIKNGGILLSALPNLSHYNNIRNIIHGKNPNNSGKKLYTFMEIDNLFNENGYDIEIIGLKKQQSVEDELFIRKLIDLSQNELSSQFETFQFIIKAKPIKNWLDSIVENILNQKETFKNISELNSYSTEEVIKRILFSSNSEIQLFNTIAISNFNQGNYDNVLPYLQAAFELDQSHKDTLYNLALTLNSFGESRIALQYLNLINERDNDVIELEDKINGIKGKKQQEKSSSLKFLIRRIEFGIEKNESEKSFIEQVVKQNYTEKDVIEIVMKDSVNKEKIYNLLATLCYENELYDYILPFLYESYDINNENENTLFNLAYFLQKFGENQIALGYLNRIVNKDSEVNYLISQLEGRLMLN
jgi:O-antigen biosynthesis protein